MITSVLESLNPEIGNSVIDLAADDALLKTREALQEGCCIGMLGDRFAEGEKTTQCELLGAQVSFPAGPLLLASIFRTPVVLFFGLYKGGNKYDIYFEEFARQISTDRKQRDKEVGIWTQEYAARLEHYMQLAPYNWFNYYDYWNEYSE
jgi:predicted LPLAT superfamily acyltransferase